MNTHRIHALSLPLVLTAALAAPAAAEERQAPAEAPELDPDVSHIGGQLVPVGKHNEYRYSFPRANVATNPIGLLADLYSVSGSLAVSEMVALRGDVAVTNFSDNDQLGYQITANAAIYFRQMYQGFYLEPGLTLRRGERDTSSKTFGPHVLAGWHWRWDSGLNTSLAFGLGREIGSDSEFDDDIFAAGYWYVGYAF